MVVIVHYDGAQNDILPQIGYDLDAIEPLIEVT